jgi:RNA polymerase sigma factor (sigma-70 family)
MHDASRRFPLPPDELADWEIPAVTAAARAFSSFHAIPHLSFDDIRQEALTAWLTHRHSYDQQRGANPKTFLNAVVRNALTDLLRAATAQRRGRDIEMRSLDAFLDVDDPERGTLHDVLSSMSADADPEIALPHRLPQQALARVRDQLNANDQTLMDLLATGRTSADMARLLDLPPSTVRSRVATLIRKLQSTELREFLD